jgi:arylsulfatase A-like enzyme
MNNQRPNIIIITTDQQRTDTLSCYGADYTSTPNIDRLAAEGVQCNRAYTVNPVCTPARLSILTGQYLSRHGAWNVGMTCPEDSPMLSGQLTDAGYRTHLIGKAHFQGYTPGREAAEKSVEVLIQDEFPTDWHGPYYGFQTVELCMGHTSWGHFGHYGQWVKSKVSEEEYKKLNQTDSVCETRFAGQGLDWDWPMELHNSAWVADRTIDFIEKRDKEQPFMLSIGFQDPHHPHCVPKEFTDKVNPDRVPLPKRREGEYDDKPRYFALANQGKLESNDVRGVFRGEFPVAGQGGGTDYNLISERDARLSRAYYHSMVKIIDQQMGRIMQCLEEQGISDNTIIVFTTDHGELLGDHGIWMKGPFHYEELVKIPFIVRWPKGIPGGQVLDSLINQVDIVPTILEAIGMEVPGHVDGVSALPMLQKKADEIRDYTIVECTDDPDTLRLKTVVTKYRKLTYYHGNDFGELYDLEKDPDEFTNLWDDPEYVTDKVRLISILLDHVERLERREDRYAYA